ncbi:MAG: response regulator [Spirochaetaceae bacterium]|jgi:signal transduction histidine kinase/CheY-like chemotaxis protein/HPt (histidine-containing phosphotransfer) domain-containing protein|nr:response regulator [Spirochaetaceae bacterium]
MSIREIIRLNYRQFLFVFLAFFIMVFVGYLYTSRMVGEQMLINGEGLIQVAEAGIKAELSQAEGFLTDTCLYIEDMLPKKNSQEEVQGLLRWITSQVYHKKERVIHGLVGIYGYLRGVYVGGMEEWMPPADFDPQSRPWYTGALEKQGGFHYTGSYHDKSTGKLVVSLSKEVITTAGERAGVIAIDIDLSEMAPLVSDLGSTSVSYYGLVLDENLDIITHSQDKNLIGRNFASVNEDCAVVAEALEQNQGRISGMEFTNHSGARSIVFFGKIFNGWYTGVITSVSSFYAKVYQMGIVISALGAVMMLLLSMSLVSVYSAKMRSEEKNKSKSDFLARMSHEIRTPMNAIVGMTELILREDLPPDICEYALGIKQSSANLLSIINDILDFSKIESGKMKIVEIPYLFASVVNDLVTIIRMRLGEKPVSLLVDIEPNIPSRLVGDEVRIRQIILNLLNNAVKYTETGSITFSIEGDIHDEEERHILLKITVEDTGIGIKEENFSKVFGDFTQFNMNRGIEGTGLGLAISKSLCDAMGGEIFFTSEYGKGTAFTILLPQKISDSAPLASVSSPETKRSLIYEMNELNALSVQRSLYALGVPNHWVAVQSDFHELLKQQHYPFIFVSYILYEGARKIVQRLRLKSKLIVMSGGCPELGVRDGAILALPAHTLSIADALNHKAEPRPHKREEPARFIAPSARILLVDDIPTNLKVAEGLMSPFKMRIDLCKSGAEAVELVRTNGYDIVFMDHMMPGMDGIEAAGRIRELGGEYCKKLPIIALTANAVSGVREMFLQNNMNDFLPKPIDMSRLTRVLQKWLPREKQEPYRKTKKAPRPEETEILPALAGIDVKKGIAMTGGTLDGYLRTLAVFLEDGKEKLPEIRACLDAGNIPLFTTFIHGIKSAAASVGAAEFADSAKRLETAGKNEDTAYIEQNTPEFLEDFALLLESVEQTVTTSRRSEAVFPDALRETLTELKIALDEMDMGKAEHCVNLLQKSSNKTDALFQAQVNKIVQCILLSDYCDAIAEIDSLLYEKEKV